MTTRFHAAVGAAALALALALGGVAAAAQPAAPRTLSDEQMDRVAAGAHPSAYADGRGEAAGKDSSNATAVLTSYVNPGPDNGGAVSFGQVSASATASAGALATASSTLSIVASF